MIASRYDGEPAGDAFVARYGQALQEYALLRLLILAVAMVALAVVGN